MGVMAPLVLGADGGREPIFCFRFRVVSTGGGGIL